MEVAARESMEKHLANDLDGGRGQIEQMERRMRQLVSPQFLRI